MISSQFGSAEESERYLIACIYTLSKHNFGLDFPDFIRAVEEMQIFPDILISACTGIVNIISTNRFTSFE